MASNEYFYGDQQHRPSGHSPSPAPYYNPQFAPSPQSTPAPSYHSGYPNAPSAPYQPQGTPVPHNKPLPTGPSPFDTVFDDNVYPMNHPAGPSSANVSQQSLYNDTAYYGHGRVSPGPGAAEDIPLQDRHGKEPDAELNDHVYDDPNGRRRRRKDNGQKVGLGQLGMFGSGKKGIPWVCYIFTIAQIGVFIGEIVKNALLTGSPIMIKPEFNYMIGPSTQVMINMGARYVPCMHNVHEIQGSTVEVLFLCPNATKTTEICPLSTLCGFSPVPDPLFNGDFDQSPKPNQWFRFIVPIFMHAGVIHIVFNMLLQLTLAKDMERAIGSVRFFLVYISAGIFGFVMGGNFAAVGIASTGASGSLFGIIALTLLDLLYSWKERKSPVKDLMFIVLDVVISFVLGLLPGLDNFSHIGGFLMGLALGVCILHSPNALRRRMGQDLDYSAVQNGIDGDQPFHKNPLGFFKGRKPLWWGWWFVRVGALVLIIVIFALLLNNFYNVGHTCSWCKYLSCLPVKNWCEIGTIQQSS